MSSRLPTPPPPPPPPGGAFPRSPSLTAVEDADWGAFDGFQIALSLDSSANLSPDCSKHPGAGSSQRSPRMTTAGGDDDTATTGPLTPGSCVIAAVTSGTVLGNIPDPVAAGSSICQSEEYEELPLLFSALQAVDGPSDTLGQEPDWSNTLLQRRKRKGFAIMLPHNLELELREDVPAAGHLSLVGGGETGRASGTLYPSANSSPDEDTARLCPKPWHHRLPFAHGPHLCTPASALPPGPLPVWAQHQSSPHSPNPGQGGRGCDQTSGMGTGAGARTTHRPTKSVPDIGFLSGNPRAPRCRLAPSRSAHTLGQEWESSSQLTAPAGEAQRVSSRSWVTQETF